jgi:hypothetical protein
MAEAHITQAQRDAWAREGIALPDGAYPIPSRTFLAKAITNFGRENPTPSRRAQIKAHIRKRARALGATDMLPASWA